MAISRYLYIHTHAYAVQLHIVAGHEVKRKASGRKSMNHNSQVKINVQFSQQQHMQATIVELEGNRGRREQTEAKTEDSLLHILRSMLAHCDKPMFMPPFGTPITPQSPFPHSGNMHSFP